MNASSRTWTSPLTLTLAGALLGMLTACCSLGARDAERTTADVQLVHDAVQFAIDEAQKSGVWNNTSAEYRHWNAACTRLKQVSDGSCAAAFNASETMCSALCKDGICSPHAKQICQVAAEGKTSALACATPGAPGTARRGWCDAAETCTSDLRSTTNACAALKAIVLPRPKSATLTLAVEEKRVGEAGIELVVVSAGGGVSSANTHTVTLLLEPRDRSTSYGIADLPPMPQARSLSPKAREMASELSALIANAVRATAVDYAVAVDGQVGPRPPLALSQLKVAFELVIDKNGKLGLAKEWPTPTSVSASAQLAAALKRSNRLEIVYAREE